MLTCITGVSQCISNTVHVIWILAKILYACISLAPTGLLIINYLILANL